MLFKRVSATSLDICILGHTSCAILTSHLQWSSGDTLVIHLVKRCVHIEGLLNSCRSDRLLLLQVVCLCACSETPLCGRLDHEHSLQPAFSQHTHAYFMICDPAVHNIYTPVFSAIISHNMLVIFRTQASCC